MGLFPILKKKSAKQLCIAAVVSAVLLFNSSIVSAEDLGGSDPILTDKLESGIVAINYSVRTDTRLKVMVEKDGNKVTYNLKGNGVTESFPLQMGDGEYKISILENVSGNKYKYVSTEEVKLQLADPNQVYLASVQNINWNSGMAAIRKAAELTRGLKTDEQRINAIYNYVISNITYDRDKLDKLSSDYLPNIDNTITAGKGICYDYASTLAAMLRSLGIPAKLVKGYCSNAKGYHAWNEIYNSKTGEWMVVDCTYDSQIKAAKGKYSMIKNPLQYSKVYEY